MNYCKGFGKFTELIMMNYIITKRIYSCSGLFTVWVKNINQQPKYKTVFFNWTHKTHTEIQLHIFNHSEERVPLYSSNISNNFNPTVHLQILRL